MRISDWSSDVCSSDLPLVESWLGVDGNLVDLFNAKQPPSPAHPLGTDELGRDLLVRLLYGGQVSLLVGLAAALCAALVGTLLGLAAGYYGGRLDDLLMRFTDGIIALPILPLLILLAAVDLGKLGLPQALASSEGAKIGRASGREGVGSVRVGPGGR